MSRVTHPPRRRVRDHRYMTEPNQAVISRLSADFNSLSSQFARVSSELLELGTVLARSSQAEPTHRPAAEAAAPEAAAREAAAPEAAAQSQPQPSPNPQPPLGAQAPRPPQYPRPGMPSGSYVPGRAQQVPPQQVPTQYPSWMMPQPPTTLVQPTAQFQNPGGTRPAAQGTAPQGPAPQHPGSQNLAVRRRRTIEALCRARPARRHRRRRRSGNA